LVMLSNHVILCHLLPLLLSVFPSSSVFQWVGSSHQVAEVLEIQLQCQSFQWIFRTDFQWWRIYLPRGRCRFNPWVGKITWKRKWQLTAVFLPGKSPGQRSLTGYRELQRVGHDLASQQQQQQLHTSLRDFWWQIVNHGQHPSAHTLFLLGP
jgi:hypothetical protein